jgi:hypothetical protein
MSRYPESNESGVTPDDNQNKGEVNSNQEAALSASVMIALLQAELRSADFMITFLTKDRIGRVLLLVHSILATQMLNTKTVAQENFEQLNLPEFKRKFAKDTDYLIVFNPQTQKVHLYKMIGTPDGLQQDESPSALMVKVVSWQMGIFSKDLIIDPERLYFDLHRDINNGLDLIEQQLHENELQKANKKKQRHKKEDRHGWTRPDQDFFSSLFT